MTYEKSRFLQDKFHPEMGADYGFSVPASLQFLERELCFRDDYWTWG